MNGNNIASKYEVVELAQSDLQKINGGVGPSLILVQKEAIEFANGFLNGLAAGWNTAKEHWNDFYSTQVK